MSPELRLLELLEPLRTHLAATERVLDRVAAGSGAPLDTQLREALAGGKRLRPALVLLTGQLFGPLSPPFYELAAAVETLHTATLVHDDVVDQAHLRRGRRTMHTKWPVGAAVLAGDYLLAEAAGLIAGLGEPSLLAVLADALRALCAGEIAQMFAAQQPAPDRESYYHTIEAKTASLLAAATEMGALLSGAGADQVAALRTCGLELGLAFQIADDVLDFVGIEGTMGKPAGGDLRQGVATLPVLIALEGRPAAGPVRAVLAGDRTPEQVAAAIAAVRESGAIESALAEARDHARRSAESLRRVPDGEAKDALRAIASLVVERSR